MVRTFLDSGVLLAAARGSGKDQDRALRILGAPNRAFVTSPFIHLELVPKAVYFKKRIEKSFYDEYFRAAEWIRDTEKIEALAPAEAARTGLAAMDALHVAAAHLAGANEFITTERAGKPIYRSSSSHLSTLLIELIKRIKRVLSASADYPSIDSAGGCKLLLLAGKSADLMAHRS
ncbi:MAG TPA: PIN domain-containing protein [Bryobacteraceae bacterium]|nr:PIN domain-containing protein [Bryobacteraceae bacterium]